MGIIFSGRRPPRRGVRVRPIFFNSASSENNNYYYQPIVALARTVQFHMKSKAKNVEESVDILAILY